MKKFLLLALLLYGVAYGQGVKLKIDVPGFSEAEFAIPPGYLKIIARYELIAGAFDSGLHVPQYNGVPTDRFGVWTADGAVAVDTSAGYFYWRNGGVWIKAAKFSDIGSTPTWQQTLTAGSTLTTNNNVNIGSNQLNFLSTYYPNGGIWYNGNTGTILIGDVAPDHNQTNIRLDDGAATINIGAQNGIFLNAIAYGSAAANGDLVIKGTSNATKTTSYVTLQEDGGLVGIGTTTPTELLHVAGVMKNTNYWETSDISLPSTPASGFGRWYVRADSARFLNDAGTEFTMGTGGGGSGVTTLAAIGASPNANGATISGVTLNLEPASASFGGVVTTGNQTWAGIKTMPTPVFTTSAQTPLVIGGTGTTSTLTLQSTSGSGTTGSDIIFKDDNTEYARILNAGNFLVGTTSATDPITGDDIFKVVQGTMTLGFRDHSTGQGWLTINSSTNGITGFLGHTNTSDGFVFGTTSAHNLTLRTNNTNKAFVTSNGNFTIGGSTDPASASGALVIFNVTPPSASVSNGVILYSEDVAASAELKVRDEAGNVTVLGPHDFHRIPGGPSEKLAWSYSSERNGEYITADMTKALRTIEDLTRRVYELEKKLNVKAKKPVKILYTGKTKK